MGEYTTSVLRHTVHFSGDCSMLNIRQRAGLHPGHWPLGHILMACCIKVFCTEACAWSSHAIPSCELLMQAGGGRENGLCYSFTRPVSGWEGPVLLCFFLVRWACDQPKGVCAPGREIYLEGLEESHPDEWHHAQVGLWPAWDDGESSQPLLFHLVLDLWRWIILVKFYFNFH